MINFTSTGLPFDISKGLKIIGLMSGTSLDGLDICYVNFKYDSGKWVYDILCANDEPYPLDIKEKLATAQCMSAYEYALFNSDYGIYLGERVKSFIDRVGAEPHFIASHGSTVFHQPAIRFTAQIGSGAGIAAETGVDTICDFRTTDVALFGQGAPLVPIGDKNLFGEYDYCLNLGGFSNISCNGIAHDISPVNYVINKYMREVGEEFDRDGAVAAQGDIFVDLLDELNNLPFYTMEGPKSLGREWVEKDVFPLIDKYSLPLEDKLRTFYEHVAMQIAKNIKGGKVLLTGGGALNKFLVERMIDCAPQCEFVVPSLQTINFKEALIFAFLGALYVANQSNCLSSVTGAKYNCIGGALYKAGGKK